MKKAIIHEFDPVIYPINLWVVIRASEKELLSTFQFSTNAKIGEALTNNAASTATAVNVNTKQRGIVVFTSDKKYLTGSIIAHEAVHVADAMFEVLGMVSQYFSSGYEPYAYLAGWAAKCINEARISK